MLLSVYQLVFRHSYLASLPFPSCFFLALLLPLDSSSSCFFFLSVLLPFFLSIHVFFTIFHSHFNFLSSFLLRFASSHFLFFFLLLLSFAYTFSYFFSLFKVKKQIIRPIRPHCFRCFRVYAHTQLQAKFSNVDTHKYK